MNNNSLKKEIIYGDLDGTLEKGHFVEIITWGDCNHITIDLANNGKHTVWNLELKDKSFVENIKVDIKNICNKFYKEDGSGIVTDYIMYEMDNWFDYMYHEWFEDEERYELAIQN